MANSEEQAKIRKPIYKKWWFWVILIVFLGIIVGSSGENGNNFSQGGTGQKTSNEPIQYISVTADELKDSLTKNPATAKETYNGKYLEIKGKLNVIDSDLKYIGVYAINDSFDLTGIHCTIKDDAQKEVVKTLSTGDTITVKGKITNVGEVLGYYLDITEISK